MTTDSTGKYQNKILTIPNILSFFRLCLIPVIVWLYVGKQSRKGLSINKHLKESITASTNFNKN